jgi:hypothetical protein
MPSLGIAKSRGLEPRLDQPGAVRVHEAPLAVDRRNEEIWLGRN